MKTGILGCGWLGLPIGKLLAGMGYEVRGSTTTNSKMNRLSSLGISPYRFDLTSKTDDSAVNDFLKEIDILILTVPPKMGNPGIDYLPVMEGLVEKIERQRIPKVLFTSSISVYEDRPGFPEYTEEDAFTHKKGNAEVLLQAERLLTENIKFDTTVLRLGGLLGLDRHPVKYLSGRGHLPNPDAPVNLVQQKDCVNIIAELVKGEQFGSTYNVVYPSHPPRKTYYTTEALKRGLEPPQFNDLPSSGKIISSKKLIKELGYQFIEDIVEEI